MKSERFWGKLAKGYDRQAISYEKTYRDTIRAAQEYLHTGMVALDIGCGSGIPTIPLSRYVKELHALDTAKEMLDIAKSKAQIQGAGNIRFLLTDVFDARFQASTYDAVMAFNILCYIPDTAAFLSRVHALLKPGGVFLSATDCVKDTRNTGAVLRSLFSKAGVLPYIGDYSMQDVEELLKRSGFEIVTSQNLHEGVPNLFVAAKKV